MSDQFDIRKNDRGVTVRFQSGRQSISRFLNKIEVLAYKYSSGFTIVTANDSPCWKWKGAVDKAGYGRFSADGEAFAHRFSYKYFVGDIPEGHHVDHVCGWRTCVNPLHLEAVWPTINWKRRDENKTHCKNGHEFTRENTHMTINGRVCKVCRYTRVKEWRERHPEQCRAIGTESKRVWRQAQVKAGRTGRF